MNIKSLKLRKLLGVLVFSAAATFVFGGNALAADLEIYCDNIEDGDQCNIQGIPSLFNEENWYPGISATKEIRVVNGDSDDTCNLEMSLYHSEGEREDPNGFARQLLTGVTSGNSDVYGSVVDGEASGPESLADLIAGSASLGEVDNNGEKTYAWTITFDRGAGNDWQEAAIEFSMALNFECGEEGSGETGDSGGGEETDSSDSDDGGDDVGEDDSGDDEDSTDDGVTTADTGTVAGIQTAFANFFPGDAAAETPEESPEEIPEETRPETEGANDTSGEVRGTATCSVAKINLLWILLAIQLGGLLMIEGHFKDKDKTLKYGVGLTALTTLIFYIFRDCACYEEASLAAFLCQWYWLVALILLGIVKTGANLKSA